MADPVIEIDGLRHCFSAVVALDGISTSIAPGTITGLVGPDAAGKTTLLRLIGGLLAPSEGRVTVLGHDMTTDAELAHPDIGYMPQRFGLYEDLTVAENLSLFADLHGIAADERRARTERLLKFTALARFTNRPAGQLSGGMKQKLGLACALLARPKLLLLDEPSVGVDPASRRELWAIVATMLAEGRDIGMAAIWATAYLDEAARCDKVLLLHDGKLLADGPPGNFLAPLAGRVFRMAAPDGRRTLARRMAGRDDVLDAQVEGDALRLVLRDGAVPSEEMTAVAPRFEDGFVALLAARDGTKKPEPATAEMHVPGDGLAIHVDDLTKRFGNFTAVDRVSFHVPRGEIFGLLGPNGAGKSTIFRMLCGLLRPTSGAAEVAGQDLLRAPAAAIDDALERFDLVAVAGQNAGLLPLGLKQRLALAAALLHGPEILFLDEPTSGVDPLTRRDFWSRIGLLADAGVTVLVTSHFMDEAEYCDRLGIINDGKLVAVDTPAGLRARVRSDTLTDPTLEDAFIALVARGTAERVAA